MPQNRRKVPFSGKAKKEQLKKKHSKNVVQNGCIQLIQSYLNI